MSGAARAPRVSDERLLELLAEHGSYGAAAKAAGYPSAAVFSNRAAALGLTRKRRGWNRKWTREEVEDALTAANGIQQEAAIALGISHQRVNQLVAAFQIRIDPQPMAVRPCGCARHGRHRAKCPTRQRVLLTPRKIPTMTTTLLRDIDPRAVSLEACEAMLEHLGKLTFLLNPLAVPLPRPADMVDGSDLGLTVQTLTAFAQRGAPIDDWETSEEAADALLTVVSALYHPALGGEGEIPGVLSEGEPESDLEQVLLGAWTRVQIGRGESVEARQLACLASCPTRTVRHHIDHGELAASQERPARVAPADARRYLTARGVRAVDGP